MGNIIKDSNENETIKLEYIEIPFTEMMLSLLPNSFKVEMIDKYQGFLTFSI